jgi:hypothetical protein
MNELQTLHVIAALLGGILVGLFPIHSSLRDIYAAVRELGRDRR